MPTLHLSSDVADDITRFTAPKKGYRPDIDGLRAVAVLLVVLFHIGIRNIKGGFVGVDIFFVISGYLISSIIISECAEGRFSLAKFYERRIRRIGPALLVVMLFAAVLAYLFLLPSELVDMARALIAASLSFSNFFFWSKAGYFDTSSETQPLLHTWSLAVEEQFYVIFPLVILAIFRWAPARLRIVVAGMAAISLGISIAQVMNSPSAAFYLPFSRAWELLLGTMVYLRVFPGMRAAWQRNAASLLGVALIAFAALRYLPTTPFPGLAAIPPCLGAALIIASGMEGTSVVGRFLSLKPMTGVGLISYSVYLWHWPILVFQHLNTFLVSGTSVHVVQAVVLFASLATGYLSWRFVEQPFRGKGVKLPRSVLFRRTFACMLVTVLLSLGVIASKGLPSRFPAEAVRVAGYLDYDAKAAYRMGTCFLTSKDSVENYDRSTCLKVIPGKKNILLMGDSHAAHLWVGLAQTFPQDNFLETAVTGCEPTTQQAVNANVNCSKIIAGMYSDFLPHRAVDEVLLAARWQPQDVPRVRETLSWMKAHGLRTVLFGPMLQYDSSLPRLLARAIQSNDPGLPARHRLEELRALDQTMSQMSTELQVPYVSMLDLLCPGAHCVEYAGRVPLQSDSSHFTTDGSTLFGNLLKSSQPPDIL